MNYKLIRNVCDLLLICSPQRVLPSLLLMSGLASVHSAWLRFHKITTTQHPPHPWALSSGLWEVESNPRKKRLYLLDGRSCPKFLQTKQNPLISAHASSFISGWEQSRKNDFSDHYMCITHTHCWPLHYGQYHGMPFLFWHKKWLICDRGHEHKKLMKIAL